MNSPYMVGRGLKEHPSYIKNVGFSCVTVARVSKATNFGIPPMYFYKTGKSSNWYIRARPNEVTNTDGSVSGQRLNKAQLC